MDSIISPGDRVSVTPYIRGFARKAFNATVLHWTKRGRLKVKVDSDGLVMVVNSDHVKKLADAHK
jgi:hypothetical protein